MFPNNLNEHGLLQKNGELIDVRSKYTLGEKMLLEHLQEWTWGESGAVTEEPLNSQQYKVWDNARYETTCPRALSAGRMAAFLAYR